MVCTPDCFFSSALLPHLAVLAMFTEINLHLFLQRSVFVVPWLQLALAKMPAAARWGRPCPTASPTPCSGKPRARQRSRRHSPCPPPSCPSLSAASPRARAGHGRCHTAWPRLSGAVGQGKDGLRPGVRAERRLLNQPLHPWKDFANGAGRGTL